LETSCTSLSERRSDTVLLTVDAAECPIAFDAYGAVIQLRVKTPREPPRAASTHRLPIRAEVRKAISKQAGDTVTIRLEERLDD
jgi:Domain of unknown function (DUF1905)